MPDKTIKEIETEQRLKTIEDVRKSDHKFNAAMAQLLSDSAQNRDGIKSIQSLYATLKDTVDRQTGEISDMVLVLGGSDKFGTKGIISEIEALKLQTEKLKEEQERQNHKLIRIGVIGTMLAFVGSWVASNWTKLTH